MAITVTAADLRAIAGGKAPLALNLVGPINRHAEASGITTPLRMAHFLAHMAHETGGFTSLVENLNYSVAGLLKTFSRARISKADAERLGRKPGEKALSVHRQQQIANRVYGGAWGRKNLGNIAPDDGWRFRGGGPYQLTGLDNYDRFGKAVGVDLVAKPELARDPDTGVEIAARYFAARMAAAADRDDIAATTKALNGGSNGLADRRAALGRAKAVLAASPPPKAPKPVPAVVPAGITDKATVEHVQRRLRELNYAEVGDIDGRIGDLTRGAVRIFRADAGLAEGDQIDAALIVALATAKPRQLAPARTEATPAEVRERVPEVKATWLGKVTGKVGTAVGAGGALLTGIWDQLGEAQDYLRPVRDFAGDVPGWLWFAALAGGAFLLWRRMQAGEAAGVAAFQQGARR